MTIVAIGFDDLASHSKVRIQNAWLALDIYLRPCCNNSVSYSRLAGSGSVLHSRAIFPQPGAVVVRITATD